MATAASEQQPSERCTCAHMTEHGQCSNQSPGQGKNCVWLDGPSAEWQIVCLTVRQDTKCWGSFPIGAHFFCAYDVCWYCLRLNQIVVGQAKRHVDLHVPGCTCANVAAAAAATAAAATAAAATRAAAEGAKRCD